MQEKELRLALVCFGGVSLAIYIHGVSKEILKLARASKAFHSDTDRNSESRKKYTYPNKNLKDIPDTERVYFDILKDLAPELDLRVIIDSIAGASAGGMNSVFLARALAHDLDMDHLRHHWLIEADVSRLSGGKQPVGNLNKLLSKPLINMLSNKYLGDSALGANVKAKLPALFGLWNMKPPFDGKHMLGLIYNGLRGMGQARNHSLLPRGHRLDLFVTLTDFYGFHRNIPLNDPAIIEEREHRHKLRFSYKSSLFDHKHASDISDFEDKDLPGLSFAARATACFPGAFPPAQLREVDSFLKSLDKKWLNKDRFIEKNFKEYLQAGLDPMTTAFLDGSILNNKPFDQAIDAIQNRPAFRNVSRRIVYIDPNPDARKVKAHGAPPSLLNTLKAAMSDIPMNEPMHDDLNDIQNHNQTVKIIKTVVESVKPSVTRLFKEISHGRIENITTTEDVSYWRSLARNRAAREAGFSYEGYARLKIRSTLANLTRMIAEICDQAPGSSGRRKIFSIVNFLVYKDGFDFSPPEQEMPPPEATPEGRVRQWVKSLIAKNPTKAESPEKTPRENQTEEKMPRWAEFLDKYDIRYQRRRLQFVIQELNSKYTSHPEETAELDKLKTSLYQILEEINQNSRSKAISQKTRDALRSSFLPLLGLSISDDMDTMPKLKLLTASMSILSEALEQLADNLDLGKFRLNADQLIAEQNTTLRQGDIGQELTINYLGFAFWDVISFSIMGAKDMGEFNQILVNRISPNDTSVLKEKNEMPLKGTALRSFGAFFSRADRENDYLWGRLGGAERLIDLLYNQAKLENIEHKIDVLAVKKRAFQTILEVEKNHLPEIPEVFEDIQSRLSKL